MTTQADRLKAEGVPITLTNGQVVRVRFGMGGLRRLEKHFGNLANVKVSVTVDDKRVCSECGKETPPEEVVSPDAVAHALAAGLSHETVTLYQPAKRGGGALEEVTRAPDANDLDELLDPAELGTYIAAVGEALEQALPPAKPGDSSGNAEGAKAPGESGTPQPPDASGEPTSSSGT